MHLSSEADITLKKTDWPCTVEENNRGRNPKSLMSRKNLFTMPVLSLTSVETCITAAFNQYAASTAGTIQVPTTQGTINVTCVIHGTQFNCGFPGYTMATADADGLRNWCITHPGNNWSFGFRGTSPSHPDSLNVTLIDYTPYMFNFHVYLT